MKATTTIAALLLFLSTTTRVLHATSTVGCEVQDAGTAEPKGQASGKVATTFTPEQLEQIVAPIALHPDALLAQILMASTYPLEIVEAYRWLQKNPSLNGKALEEALKQTDWDPSVKAICGLREVVKQMNDNLDWTQDLGDAFLGQKAEVMETVQKMRKKALEAGNLKTSEQQKVSQDGQVIIVESTNTEVVYVPTYSPVVVYGPSWYYPYYYYPPIYVAPRPGYGFIGFTVGIAWGAAIWGGCNWRGNDINININHFNNFNNNTNINAAKYNKPGSGNGQWNHDASHRKGVNYKSPQTARQFGAGQGQSRVAKDQARGFDRSPGSGAAGAGSGNRAGATAPRPATRPAGGIDRGAQRPAAAKPAARPSGGSSALSGSRSPGADRSASSRGSRSRASSGGARASGGGRRR